MMKLSRRDFLKHSLASLAVPFLPTLPGWMTASVATSTQSGMIGRITRPGIRVYAEPSANSKRVMRLERDALIALLEEVMTLDEPLTIPRWYRVAEGYLHSAYVQRVDGHRSNTPLRTVPKGGILAEVTVPWTQSVYLTKEGYETPLYRLYYRSLYWITGLDHDPQGHPRYVLTDDWLQVRYQVPAADLRPLDPEEYAPLQIDVPAQQKRIEVSLKNQTFTAYQENRLVRTGPVSTGKKWMETPAGDWQVDRKYPSRHMGDGALTADLRAYELPGVPWATFFHDAGIAFHGTYWHDNFGVPMSRGCVNMRMEDALWLFRWTSPSYINLKDDKPLWKSSGKDGTRVVVGE